MANQQQESLKLETENFLARFDKAIEKDIIYGDKNSVEVDWQQAQSTIWEFFEEHREQCFSLLWETLCSRLHVLTPFEYEEIVKRHPQIRIRNYHETLSMGDLDTSLFGKFTAINCIVTRSTAVLPLLEKAVFTHDRCGKNQTVKQDTAKLKYPVDCEDRATCRQSCRGKWELNLNASEFVNTQILTFQENPEDAKENTNPIRIDIKLPVHLVGLAKAGDRVIIYGVIQPEQQDEKSRVLSFTLDLNNIEVLGENFQFPNISSEDEVKIRKLVSEPEFQGKVVGSIAPSIFGYEDIKLGLALLLFGGVPKTLPDGLKIRGDLNVLLVGDPGTAKSSMLQYVCNLSPRGVFATGRGSSGVGLTAAVVRDKASERFMLEAGTVVLASGGVACVDELEKMNKDDQGNLHEALAQQVVTINKAGIRAVLPAKCAFLAAANPKGGRYDPYRTPRENIDFSPTLLSRFDLIWVIRDEPEQVRDLQVADHMLKAQTRREEVKPPIDVGLFRKYVALAKQIEPKLSEEAQDKIREFYFGLRNQSGGVDAPMSITPRQLESLVRLTEASARMNLRDVATQEDALVAVELLQKSMTQIGFDPVTGKIDIDAVEGRIPKSKKERKEALLNLIERLCDNDLGGVTTVSTILFEAKKTLLMEQKEAENLLDLLHENREILKPREGLYRKVEGT